MLLFLVGLQLHKNTKRTIKDTKRQYKYLFTTRELYESKDLITLFLYNEKNCIIIVQQKEEERERFSSIKNYKWKN